MFKLTCFLFFIGILDNLYAINNNELLTRRNNYCYFIESQIYNLVLDKTLELEINNCLSANTYQRNEHKFRNFFCHLDGHCLVQPVSLGVIHEKYKLQYFSSTGELIQTINDIKYKLEQYRLQQYKTLSLEDKERKHILYIRKKHIEDFKRCNLRFANSNEYKNYYKLKNDIINNQYNNCINHTQDNRDCSKLRTKAQLDYEIKYKKPNNKCILQENQI